MPTYTASYTKLDDGYMGQLVEYENLSLDEEAALEKFLDDERNGTLITYSAEEVRRHLELVY